MRTSCFASETCAGGGDGGSVRLQNMLKSERAFVATVQDSETGHMRYVGSITVDPMSKMAFLFPGRRFDTDAVVLGNLCVAEAYRRHGVGKMLLQRAIREASSPTKVHLMIARWGLFDSNGDVVDVFRQRVERLKSTYENLNFECIGENSTCMLMKCLV
jgi:GNAT superfamily N-acetyltransferase